MVLLKGGCYFYYNYLSKCGMYYSETIYSIQYRMKEYNVPPSMQLFNKKT